MVCCAKAMASQAKAVVLEQELAARRVAQASAAARSPPPSKWDAVTAKRDAAADAKAAASPVQMNYLRTTPDGYNRRLIEEMRVKRAREPSAKQRTHLDKMARRREFAQQARILFTLVDNDHNHFLEIDELAKLVETVEGAAVAFNQIDENRDGYISRHEWHAFAMRIWDASESDADYMLAKSQYFLRLQHFLAVSERLFDRFDVNQDGKLDRNEVAALTRRTDGSGGSDHERFMQFVDTNGSGEIDREEWRSFLTFAYESVGADYAWELVMFLRKRTSPQTRRRMGSRVANVNLVSRASQMRRSTWPNRREGEAKSRGRACAGSGSKVECAGEMSGDPREE